MYCTLDAKCEHLNKFFRMLIKIYWEVVDSEILQQAASFLYSDECKILLIDSDESITDELDILEMKSLRKTAQNWYNQGGIGI